MTKLDHSSVVSLLHDLHLHWDSLFRFRYFSDNTTSPPWRLKSAFADGDGVQFRIEYTTTTGNREDFFAILYGGQLAYSGTVLMTVVLEGEPPRSGGISDFVDNSRQRLNDNLRGVFS